VAAALLTRADFDVIGVTFNQWPKDAMASSKGNGCCTPRTIDDARRVCEILGIPHYVMDFRREFEAAVIDPWTSAYLNGETPNPCVLCNRSVRFGTFFRKADELDAEFVASGHYARAVRDDPSGRVRLLCGLDPAKDQSYMLHVLGQRQLRRVLFPLGELRKARVRELAAEFGLPVADKPDSQEICFVPDNNYAAVVRRQGSTGPGDVVDRTGRRVGRHHGLEAVTVGQRRGLNLGGGQERRYVTTLDSTRNEVVVGARTDALAEVIGLREVHWVAGTRPPTPVRVTAKTRYHMVAEPAVLTTDDRNGASLAFDTPTWAPAPGQSAVIYAGDEVLGGGTILKAEAA
jgi:tRNA-specific 2-thiouridylase